MHNTQKLFQSTLTRVAFMLYAMELCVCHSINTSAVECTPCADTHWLRNGQQKVPAICRTVFAAREEYEIGT